jgi:hypothetical protein
MNAKKFREEDRINRKEVRERKCVPSHPQQLKISIFLGSGGNKNKWHLNPHFFIKRKTQLHRPGRAGR